MNTAQPAELPGWRHVYSGKVRDLYEPLDASPRVLVVASDRISAFDHILPTPIPDKGVVLTALSQWWFNQLDHIVGNHLITTTVDPAGTSAGVPPAVAGRAMVCHRLDMIEVECVARGYLTGSGLSEYRATGSVCGVSLPAGLVDGSVLEAPIFTPATKAEVGEHDENVTFEHVADLLGGDVAEQLRDLTLALYRFAADVAEQRGIILADTKFEFGYAPNGELVIGDEVLTPDSSRYWPKDLYRVGQSQPSFDKQYVRDWLATQSGWDPASATPPPPLPDDVVERTRQRYLEAYTRLTGEQLAL